MNSIAPDDGWVAIKSETLQNAFYAGIRPIFNDLTGAGREGAMETNLGAASGPRRLQQSWYLAWGRRPSSPCIRGNRLQVTVLLVLLHQFQGSRRSGNPLLTVV